MKYRDEFEKILDIFCRENIFEDVVLVGSWAEFLYREAGVVKDRNFTLKTLDVDFLVMNLRKPNPPKNIVSKLEASGFLIDRDRLTNLTKIYTKDGFQIEFLIESLGKGDIPVYETNLGVSAQGLRNVGILKQDVMDVDYAGKTIKVASPESYVLHKMIINEERKENKRESDREKIVNLFVFLDKGKLKRMASELPEKQKRKVQKFCAENKFEF